MSRFGRSLSELDRSRRSQVEAEQKLKKLAHYHRLGKSIFWNLLRKIAEDGEKLYIF